MIIEQTRMVPVPGGEVFVKSMIPEAAKAASQTPLIIAHGGPGGSHFLYPIYLRALAENRPFYCYDQLGSYKSPALFSESLLPIERFVEELHSVINACSLERPIVMGHSWGGSIAIDYALAHPERLTALVLSSPLISTPRLIADANRLIAECPPDTQNTIKTHLAAGTIDDPAYKEAESVYYKRYFCRLDPWPEALRDSFKLSNGQIYRAMWGASEFTCNGTLSNYDRFDDLHRLTMPTLIMGGRYDGGAAPETMRDAAARIPNSQFMFSPIVLTWPILKKRKPLSMFCKTS